MRVTVMKDYRETMKTLSKRLTHTYVGTCSHLDKWEDIGLYKEMARNQISKDDENPEETTVYEVAVYVESDKSKKEIEDALYSEFTSHGCSHDYDCCGCWSFYASEIKYIDQGTWRLKVSASRNY